MNENEEFDLDQFQAEFEQEWEDQETPDIEQAEPEIIDEEVAVEDDGVENPSPEEEPETIHDTDAEKRNRAFADMRRQAEEAKVYADFIKKLADQNGTTPEEILSRYEERQVEQEAEKQNIPVDVYKRLNELERTNMELEEKTFAEKFDLEVNHVKEKENLSDEDLSNVFKYMYENNLVDGNRKPLVPFEQAYKLANLDSIVEKSKKEAVQTNLEEKRNRQVTSAQPTGTGAAPNSDGLSDEELDNMLESMDLLDRI